MSGGGSGGGGSQTVSQVQQIPEFSQQFSQENQDLARSLASQPYPQYQGPLIAGFTPTQVAGQQAALNAAGSYQPAVGGAINATQSVMGQNPMSAMMPMLGQGAQSIAQAGQGDVMGQTAPALNAGAGMIMQGGQGNALGMAMPFLGAGTSMIGQAASQNPLANDPANAGVINSYMSPYVEASLRPQIDALQEQIGQQQNAIDARATQAGAFGDARQGVAEALTNKYGNQALSGIVGQGYNTAYANALQTAQQQQQLAQQQQQFGANTGAMLAGLGLQTAQTGLQQQGQQIGAGQALGQLGLGAGGQSLQERGLQLSSGQALGQLGLGGVAAGQAGQQIGLQGASQLGNLGALQQQLGLGAANAIYNVGSQQQDLQQQQLNTAYQQFQNQVNWPYQGLNTRLSALSNSPYSISNSTTLPGANQAASNLGMFASLAGGLGGLASPNVAPFGGQAYDASKARAY